MLDKEIILSQRQKALTDMKKFSFISLKFLKSVNELERKTPEQADIQKMMETFLVDGQKTCLRCLQRQEELETIC